MVLISVDDDLVSMLVAHVKKSKRFGMVRVLIFTWWASAVFRPEKSKCEEDLLFGE